MMKQTIKKTGFTVLLIALAMSLAACGSGDIYDSLAKDGYTVKVRYEVDGAIINETQNVNIVEVFSEGDLITTADGTTGIRLLAPDDPLRGKDGAFRLAKNDGEVNFFQIGWYTKRTLRTDENGNPLDAYGVLTAESGREQGYVYEDRWDFDRDVVDPEALENGELVLYAAWAPTYLYEFYLETPTGEFEKFGSVRKAKLLLPTWNQRGKLYMNDVPALGDGMVFEAAYLDEALTNELSEEFDGRQAFVDEDRGIATCLVIPIYVTWTEAPEA